MLRRERPTRVPGSDQVDELERFASRVVDGPAIRMTTLVWMMPRWWATPYWLVVELQCDKQRHNPTEDMLKDCGLQWIQGLEQQLVQDTHYEPVEGDQYDYSHQQGEREGYKRLERS